MNLNQQILLCVNIDHIATLRQARGGIYPSVVEAAQLAEISGADGITIHLREDRRHIQDADVFELKEIIRGRYTLEMAASQEILEIAKKIKPDLLTIVPEKRQEITTEGGLNVTHNASELKEFLLEVKKANLQASLFIDPDLATIEKAREIGASRIELHTGKYANCPINSPEAESEFQNLKKAAEFAHSIGFIVNVGHGLNLANLPKILQIPNLQELHIGHSIIARAVIVGLNQAVKRNKGYSQMTEKYPNKKHQVSKYQDCIIVEGIACYALIGVADNERVIGQNLRIDLEVYADLRQAGESDLLSDTVSYIALSQKVQSVVQKKDYRLLEHLADCICQEILQDFITISATGIRVFKPHIPSRDFKGEASVYIFRERD